MVDWKDNLGFYISMHRLSFRIHNEGKVLLLLHAAQSVHSIHGYLSIKEESQQKDPDSNLKIALPP